MEHRRSRTLVAAFLILLLGGCSETTLRRDSLSRIEIGDRDILVSWVEAPPDAIDLVVAPAPGADKPLEFAMAVEAAGRVAARRCLFRRVHAVLAPVHYPDAGFAFRYACGAAPVVTEQED